MQKSDAINDLFAAISKAQGEFTSVKFDKVNPFFNNAKYATLSATQDMYRPVLAKHGLGLIQSITVEGEDYFLETLLIHASGQFMSDKIKLMIDRKNMQGLGSAITYAKRYAAQAILGICGDEDDDGNAASPKPDAKKQHAQKEQAIAKDIIQNTRVEGKEPPTAPPKPVPNNMAPANQSQMALINTLLEQRGIPSGDLDFLVLEGYGFRGTVPPQWIAKEIIHLLGDQNTTQGTIVEKTTAVRERRLAAQKKS
jgi:ERF superfamily